MKPFSALSSLFLLASVCAGSAAQAKPEAAPAPSPAPSAASSDAAAENAFTFAMYGKIRGGTGNVFFSGASLRQALGIAYLGARGQTASEMSAALHLDPDATKSAAAAKSEIADWKAAGGDAKLSVANRLWADRSYKMRPEFVRNAADAYGSPLDPVNFSTDPEGARQIIDAWVGKQTNDKIPELLPAGSVDASTRVVITNAIYFKGTWKTAFQKGSTFDESFHAAGGDKKVPMMHQTATFSMGGKDGVSMLEMPYEKSDLAMDILLPDASDGLAKLEAGLTPEAFAGYAATLTPSQVVVTIPKTKFTWGKSVVPELKDLGVRSAFGAADFGGMGDGLQVSDVVHKAFVAVDEEGTEAAAATGVVMREMMSTSAPIVRTFKADHPYLFAIRDVKRGRVLFMGRVTTP